MYNMKLQNPINSFIEGWQGVVMKLFLILDDSGWSELYIYIYTAGAQDYAVSSAGLKWRKKHFNGLTFHTISI